MLGSLQTQIYRLHVELVKNNLVVGTSGNVSGRDVATGSDAVERGVHYKELAPEGPASLGAIVPGLGLGCLVPGSSVENGLDIGKLQNG